MPPVGPDAQQRVGHVLLRAEALMIIMREQLNLKQRQAISETPAKGGRGLVETLLLVTWPDGRLSGQATLARLLPSGLSTHRVLFAPGSEAPMQRSRRGQRARRLGSLVLRRIHLCGG